MLADCTLWCHREKTATHCAYKRDRKILNNLGNNLHSYSTVATYYSQRGIKVGGLKICLHNWSQKSTKIMALMLPHIRAINLVVWWPAFTTTNKKSTKTSYFLTISMYMWRFCTEHLFGTQPPNFHSHQYNSSSYIVSTVYRVALYAPKLQCGIE